MFDRNREILLFLWRWKLVSTAALWNRFTPGFSPVGGYKVFRRLWQRQLIHRITFADNDNEALCSLTRKGFASISGLLPELREEGFRSEFPYHDFLTTAFHLGEWFSETPRGCELFSEQQLRRMHVQDYPAWVPKTDLHRPDGYWRVAHPEGVATIALEVELRKKHLAKYNVLSRFYRDQSEIFRVVWLVPSTSQASAIHRVLVSGVPNEDHIHTFILEKEFLRMGWNAPLHFGPEEGKSLAFLLGKRMEMEWKDISLHFLLDTRRFPFPSATSIASLNSPKTALGRDLSISTQPYSAAAKPPVPFSTLSSDLTSLHSRRFES